MGGSTLDDPLSERYNKLGCSISPLDKESDDYKMILKYMEKTYEPVKVGDVEYGVSVDNIFVIESSASPSLDEIKKLPNKVLLWCEHGAQICLGTCIRVSCLQYALSVFQAIWYCSYKSYVGMI
nr:protein ADP-ribosyltransferase PARP3-like [Malus domestica]